MVAGQDRRNRLPDAWRQGCRSEGGGQDFDNDQRDLRNSADINCPITQWSCRAYRIGACCMAKESAKKKAKAKPAGDLNPEEIKKIADELVALRKKILATGATALSPTPEWNLLRKEIALLNKTLNADTAAKLKASHAAIQSEDAPGP